MPSAGCLPQRILRVAKPWAFESCEARGGVAWHDPGHPRGIWWHLRGASGPCRADGRRLPGEPQTGGSSDARGRVGRGEPTPRHAHYARGPEPLCGPGPGRTPVPGRCAGSALGGRRDLVPTWTGFVYLAIVLDVFSRRVVGWSMTHHLRTELVLGALNMAFGQRRPDGVVHHSDRGRRATAGGPKPDPARSPGPAATDAHARPHRRNTRSGHHRHAAPGGGAGTAGRPPGPAAFPRLQDPRAQ